MLPAAMLGMKPGTLQSRMQKLDCADMSAFTEISAPKNRHHQLNN